MKLKDLKEDMGTQTPVSAVKNDFKTKHVKPLIGNGMIVTKAGVSALEQDTRLKEVQKRMENAYIAFAHEPGYEEHAKKCEEIVKQIDKMRKSFGIRTAGRVQRDN